MPLAPDRPSRLLGVLLLVVGLAAGALPTLVASDAAAPAGQSGGGPADTSGAAGVGDAYFPRHGNGGYRVGHYDVRVRFDPATERLSGVTRITAHAAQRLTSFHLDLALRARSVRVAGLRAGFRQDGLELVVRPAEPVRPGERMRVRVRYAGVPARLRVGGFTPWVTTRDGAVAVGEPEIASWWFPSNDHPVDRASFDVTATVPRGRQVLSNGRLLGRERVGADRVRFHWRNGAPMATYLAFLAVGRYEIETGRAAGFPYTYAVSELVPHRRAAGAWESLRYTAPATRLLTRWFGPYPFGSIGGVVPGGVRSHNFGYALENQTRPLYDPSMFSWGRNRSLVVHEMAHQWFGDAVTVRRWRHVWLNEGLATYAEWMWEQHVGGRTAQRIFDAAYQTRGPGHSFWNLRIGDPGSAHLFDSRVYERGAMTVHALRNRIGGRDFFATARRWVHDNRDGVGSTHELRKLAERVSGERLGRLFHVWLFSGRKPPATQATGVVR